MVTCSRITMMKLILSFWETSEAKTGGFRPMFMAMEVPALAERKDMVSGLIQPRISISTVFSGQILRSCKHLSDSEPPHTYHIWFFSGFYTLHYIFVIVMFFIILIIGFYTLLISCLIVHSSNLKVSVVGLISVSSNFIL